MVYGFVTPSVDVIASGDNRPTMRAMVGGKLMCRCVVRVSVGKLVMGGLCVGVISGLCG